MPSNYNQETCIWWTKLQACYGYEDVTKDSVLILIKKNSSDIYKKKKKPQGEMLQGVFF